MRTFPVLSTCIILLCLCALATAQEATPLGGWSYSSDAPYLSDQYADTGGKLTDGEAGRANTVIYSGGSIVINVTLDEMATVERVLANIHRHNMNYQLSDVKVQAMVGGHYQEIGQVQGFWGPTEERDFEIAVDVTPTQTRELRLVFSTPSLLSISELQLFGQAAALQTADADMPFTDVTQATVREEDLDGDGTPEIILENAKVGLVFYPAHGGVCKVLYLKEAGVNLVSPQGPDQGMFRDQLWDPLYFFSTKHYHLQTGGDGNNAWVELWTTGEGGILSFTEVRKRFTLTGDSEVITADYTLTNDPSSQTDFVYGWWWHNFLGASGQTNSYYFPTVEGVQELTYDPATGEALKGDHWFRDLARGWAAVKAESGAGMAIQVPFRYLNTFYAWIGTGYPVATLEWRYNRLQVRSGEKLESQIRILPFNDLPRVDGSVDGAVGAIEIAGAEGGEPRATVHVKLADGAQPLTAQVGWRKSDEAEADFGITEAVTVQPGDTAVVEAATPQLQPGSYVIVCRLSRDGEVLDDFERPFSVGGARLVYHREPLMEREGLAEKEDVAGLPRHDLSREVVTPHIKWANPLPGGAIKALTLTGDRNSREIIELAQRMEMDFTYVKFRTTLDSEWLYQGDRSIPTLAHAQRRLMEELEDEYDLFLISGLKWDHHFTPEIRERITEQVRGGAGLIFIEPDGFSAEDPLGGAMGIANDRNMWGFYGWQQVASHPITDALPWELFPETRRMDYTTWPAGEVIATSGEGEDERPLLVTSQLGEGRLLSATWDVLTHAMSYRGYAGLTPILSYRGKYLQDEFAEMTWDYHEHWYALLARACTWAAKRESPVRIASIEAPDVALGQDATVQIVSRAATAGDYTAGVTFRDRRSNVLAETRVAWQPDLSVPLPENLRSGLTLVDVIVRDAAGASVGWGAGSFTVEAPARIESVEVEERTILGDWVAGQESVQQGRGWTGRSPFAINVNLDLIQPADAQWQVRARLYDTHDRLLGEETQAVQAGEAQMRFAMQPAELRNMGVEWRIELIDGERVLDTDQARAICAHPREYNTLHFQSWNGMYLWRSEYLWDTVHRRVEELGLDVSRYGSVEYDNGLVWDEHWYNRMNWWGGLLGRPTRELPEFRLNDFARIKAEWDRTGDKSLLAREPCLNDPAWREAMYQHLLTQAEGMQQFGGSFCYDTGDEMSLTYYRSYFDFCWSEHCLPEFRAWLAEKYGDLGGLNAVWGTMYASWDDVVPLTLQEAREAQNPAAWADHRDFMDTVMAEFMTFVRETIQEVDPEAKVGMSGTQAPRAGNGMDWWKMSKAYNHYISYNTAWSNEMRRSFQGDTIVGQAPYNAGYWQAGRGLENRMWWCLLHDTTGIGAWTTHLFFYGDFTFSESGRDTRDNLREMREGVWDQVRQATRDNDGIALHYSQSTVRAGELLDRIDEVEAIRDAWVKLLVDLGLQFEFVSEEQIEAGHLQEAGYRLLILPESLALSRAEEVQIRDFVNGGGAVMADMGCAVVDKQCRTNASPALDDLFGIRHTEATGQPPAQGMTLASACGTLAAGTEVKITVPEDNLQLDGGTAFGAGAGEAAAPALISNQVGSGRAIYLNMDLSQFEAERKFHSPTEAALRSIMLGLLGDAGIHPVYELTFESGTAPHVEMVRYHLGDLTILGLLRDYDGSAPDEIATVHLPEAAHVYNMRQHKALGRLAEVTVPMAPGQAVVLCISPRELGAPAVALDAASAQVGGTLGYTVTGGAGDVAEVAHVTVLRPDGSVAGDYTQNVILRDGWATGAIPLALSDETGTWRVIARSALTGATAESSFEVR